MLHNFLFTKDNQYVINTMDQSSKYIMRMVGYYIGKMIENRLNTILR